MADLTERYQKLKKDQEFNKQYMSQLEVAIKQRLENLDVNAVLDPALNAVNNVTFN